MTSNIINFQIEAGKRRATEVVEVQINQHQYVLELEHDILELQHQVRVLHRDLERERAVKHTG